MLSLLYGPTPTFIQDYWKNHSFDYMDLCHKDPLEEGMATHSHILAWRIPGTDEPGNVKVHSVTQSQTRLKRLSMTGLDAYKLLTPRNQTWEPEVWVKN